MLYSSRHFLFFFNDTATTEIYTLSLHDALPISSPAPTRLPSRWERIIQVSRRRDRKSTRLNSSHITISYAVFCLKKKKNMMTVHRQQDREYDRQVRYLTAHG